MMFFDSITLYFESFTRDGLRRPGYSKDGKFKEVQIVVLSFPVKEKNKRFTLKYREKRLFFYLRF
ncbi:hypothetical protein V3317_01930 [Mycoplasmopsis felis]|uniref:hypothetical protein n=1 Tax=Mycoplasmopsis felis TaxID=33923 RepID=UPI002F91B44A